MSCWKFQTVALFALLSLPSTASARTHFGTVVLDNGQRIEQVRYKVKTLFNLLEIVRIGDKQVQRKFKFDQIEALFDKDGKNVTRKYLGRFARTRLGRQPANTRRPDSKLWNVALRVGSNLSVPPGPVLNGKIAGLGFGAEITIPVNHFLAIRGAISRSGFGNSASDIILPTTFSFSGLSSSDNSLSLTRYTVAGEYYFYNHKESYPPSFTGFIYTGLGLGVQRRTSGYTTFDGSTGELHSRKIKETISNLLSSTGVGFDAFVNSRFGLEFSINMDVVSLRRKSSFGRKYAYIFDLRLGVMTFF